MQKWTVRTSSIYKCFLWLYCIVLGCRDLFQSMGLPVFIFLALLFFIPFALLVLEFVGFCWYFFVFNSDCLLSIYISC